MTDTSGPLLPPRVDEGYYTAYQSPNVFGRESARFAGEALESARQSAAAAGESPGAYLPNIAMSGLNLADAGLRYGIGAFSELLGGTPAQESRLMREIYGIPEAFAGSGFIRGASALDDLLEASTANRALRNEMGLANFRARTAGFTPDAPRPVNYYVPTPEELARMEADSTPAQADYLLRRREALALKNEGVSNEEIFAETGIDFIPVRGADGELMDEIPALPTGPSQVNIDRLQELFAQGEGASAPLSEIVSPNETLMGLRGEIPGRVEITSSGPGVGSFDRKTGTIRINPNRATPEMVEDAFRHENVHSIMGSGGSARTLGGANALSEADLTQQYLGLARTARADARSRLESGEITQDQFDEINRRISAAEEGMLVTPSERYTRDIGELLAREAMDPQFGTMSVALTPSEALNPLIRPNVGLIQRADQAASAALLPYRRLARMDEAINRGISTLSAPLSRFFPDEKPRTPAAMLSTLRTQPTVPVPQSRAMARESFSTISPSDIVSEVAAGGRRNAPRYMTLPSEDLMAADFDPEAMIRALREGVPAAEARLAEDMRIGNERIRAESLARSAARGPSQTVDDLFNVMGEEGAGTEYPGIGAALDRYISRSQTPRELEDNFNLALNDPDYPLYRDALQTNLRQTFGEYPIPVTRIEGYADPSAPKTGSTFTVSQDDVFFVGSPDERELIARLPDGTVRSVRLADRETAFTDLANMQRGAPELAMLRAQETMGGGVMNWAVEHIGDLTHRMAERGGVFGREYVEPKVSRAIDILESGYGFRREFLENLDANQRARNARTGRDNFNVLAQTNSALKRYADEHRDLPVYNEMQRAARDAAVALGEQDFDETLRNLRIIKDALDDGTYEARAMEFPGQPTAARGPREFARGGEVMMRSDMSSQLSGGIGGFAGDAKNMFRGPRGLEGFAQYMQAGGEVGRGQGQGSTVGRPVSGFAMGTNLGADEEFLTSVRNRVIAQSGVDPIDVAMEEGVDPDLFLRLIAQESGGRADAQSDAGAYGFTQLMDATARELGVDRTDPEQNLRGGARYLRQQLDSFQEVPLALAAYNAGPGAVRRFGGIPPYSETRAYVARILGVPGGEMGVSPPMRPDPIVPTPRPAVQGPNLSGDPLMALGQVVEQAPFSLTQAPAMPEQDMPMPQNQPQQTTFTRGQGQPGERMFMDLMRTMP